MYICDNYITMKKIIINLLWIVTFLMIVMVLTSWIVLMLAQGILSSILILSACHSPFNALLNIIVAPFCHHHYIIRRTSQKACWLKGWSHIVYWSLGSKQCG